MKASRLADLDRRLNLARRFVFHPDPVLAGAEAV